MTYVYADPNGLNRVLPTLDGQLHAQDGAFGKLLALSSATLARCAIDYDLHVSVLLNGARGIGKFTVTTWVARCLGMHLLEVRTSLFKVY